MERANSFLFGYMSVCGSLVLVNVCPSVWITCIAVFTLPQTFTSSLKHSVITVFSHAPVCLSALITLTSMTDGKENCSIVLLNTVESSVKANLKWFDVYLYQWSEKYGPLNISWSIFGLKAKETCTISLWMVAKFLFVHNSRFSFVFQSNLSSMFQCGAARDYLTRSFSPFMDNQSKQNWQTLI